MSISDRKHLIIKSEHERLVFGEVYVPGLVDTDGETMTSDEIKKAAYNFMREQRITKIDLQHNTQETGSYVVESFIARSGDPDGFVEGSWVIGTKIESDLLWDMVLKGDLNGFSLYGAANVAQKRTVIDKLVAIKGDTDSNMDDVIPSHTHYLELSFNDDGAAIKTSTSEVLGHKHDVITTTATEEAFGHSHRFSIA